MAKAQAWQRVLFLLSLLLLGSSFAGRVDSLARKARRGFHPNAFQQFERRALGVDNTTASHRRYYTNSTKKYFVESLPDVPKTYLTEMYSGLMPVYNSLDRALFFVFQPRVGDPVDEVTIWLNGGPGCSSLEGFFQENGLIRWTWGQYTPQINPYSWVNLTNMLWVEQPVGTGFSVGKINTTNEIDVATDFINFFKNFETTFGIKNYRIFVTGESYAGRYVPYISAAMLDQNNTEYYNLSGALMYDPCIGAFDAQNDIATLPFIEANNNVLGYNESFLQHLGGLDQTCGYAKFRDEYLVFPPNGTQPHLPEPEGKCTAWDQAYYAAYAQNPCFNPYMLSWPCPLLADPLGYPTDLEYSYPGEPIYFNRPDVKRAMHAPKHVQWSECAATSVFVGGNGGANSVSAGAGGPEKYGDLSPDPIQGVLPKVIEATGRVLISNGQLDMEILTNATLLAIQNMTWNGKMGFQSAPSTPIIIDLVDLQYQPTFNSSGFPAWTDNWGQGFMGKQHQERGLLFSETALSGHMQPQFQPRSAYRHLQWVLGRIDAL